MVQIIFSKDGHPNIAPHPVCSSCDVDTPPLRGQSGRALLQRAGPAQWKWCCMGFEAKLEKVTMLPPGIAWGCPKLPCKKSSYPEVNMLERPHPNGGSCLKGPSYLILPSLVPHTWVKKPSKGSSLSLLCCPSQCQEGQKHATITEPCPDCRFTSEINVLIWSIKFWGSLLCSTRYL